jgi:hypothetical protein
MQVQQPKRHDAASWLQGIEAHAHLQGRSNDVDPNPGYAVRLSEPLPLWLCLVQPASGPARPCHINATVTHSCLQILSAGHSVYCSEGSPGSADAVLPAVG